MSDRRAGLGIGQGSKTMGGGYSAFNVRPSISPPTRSTWRSAAVPPGAVHAARPSAELIVFPIVATVRAASAANKTEAELNALDVEEQVTGYELAYLVQTRMLAGANRPVYHDTVVSANDGRVLKQWKALQTVVGTGNSQYNGAVPISTTLSGSTYSMKDATRGTGGTFGAHGDHQRQPRHQRRRHLHQQPPTPGATASSTSPAAAPPTPTARPPRSTRCGA